MHIAVVKRESHLTSDIQLIGTEELAYIVPYLRCKVEPEVAVARICHFLHFCIVIYNVVFHPKGTVTTGAGIAVPAVGKLANDIISYKGMQRTGDTVLGFDGSINVQEKNYAVIDVIPDFTGASKKHLLPLFKDGRFNLNIKGEGWVVKQSPAPGTPVEPGMTLEFELQ